MMLFKDIKHLIYSPLIIIIDKIIIKDTPISELGDTYDKYQVIGIRAKSDFEYESYVVISLKKL